MFLTVSSRLALGWLVNSVELMTSIGDAELVTVRSVRRVPVITISSPLGGAGATTGAVCAQAAGVIAVVVNNAADVRRTQFTCLLTMLVMMFPLSPKRLPLACALQQEHACTLSLVNCFVT